MTLELETHTNGFILLPLIALVQGECEDPQCSASHLQISFGLFIWTLHVRFESGDDDVINS